MRSRSWSDENIDIYERRWRLEQTSNFKRPESVAENREKAQPGDFDGHRHRRDDRRRCDGGQGHPQGPADGGRKGNPGRKAPDHRRDRQDELEKANVKEREFISTGRGETPCFDPLTNTCFKSDIESLRRAENTLNKRMRDEVKITVNEFLMEIGLEPCDDSIGETMGWDIDKGYIELDFSSQLVDGVPYLVLGHRVPPVYLGW